MILQKTINSVEEDSVEESLSPLLDGIECLLIWLKRITKSCKQLANRWKNYRSSVSPLKSEKLIEIGYHSCRPTNSNHEEERDGLGKGSKRLGIRGLRTCKSHLNLPFEYVSTLFKHDLVST